MSKPTDLVWGRLDLLILKVLALGAMHEFGIVERVKEECREPRGLVRLVVQREREIGVRLALGATPGQIAGMVLSHVLRWTGGGLAAGAAGAALAAWWLRRVLFHVSPADPLAFGGAAVLLVALALLAAWEPARRAAKVDPILALRQD